MRESVMQGQPLFALKRDAAAKVDGIAKALGARLKQVGIADKVRLALVDKVRSMATGQATPAEGRYFNRLIEIAIGAEDKGWVLNHEIVHALRGLGAFKPAEWTALEKAAHADTGRMAEIRKRYAKRNLTEAQLLEEAIADMFADWAAGRAEQRGFIRTAFERVRAMLKAIGASFREAGYTSAADIFEGIERGYVGERVEADEGMAGIDDIGPMGPSERFMAAAWHGTAVDFDRFETRMIGSGEGAQAYGWGLYFAGRKEVAEFYRQQGSRSARKFGALTEEENAVIPDWVSRSIHNRLTQDGQASAHDAALEHFMDFKNRVQEDEEAIKNPKTSQPWLIQDRLPDLRTIRDALRKLIRAEEYDSEPAGRLYKVELAPAEDEYLLWDEPVSEQSATVKAGLEKVGINLGWTDPRLEWVTTSRAKDNAVVWRYDITYPNGFTAPMGFAAPGRYGGFNYYIGPRMDEQFFTGNAPTLDGAQFEIEKRASAQYMTADALDRNRQSGQSIYQGLAKKLGGERMLGPVDKQYGPVAYPDDEAASKTLRAAGIRGVKYLDQGSRAYTLVAPSVPSHDWIVENSDGRIVEKTRTREAAQAWIDKQTTYNYVIFDDRDVAVQEKFAERKTVDVVDTADGLREQLVLPGAEQITDREIAERKMRGKKTSTAPQKDASDLPLFDIEGAKAKKAQTELFSLPRPPRPAGADDRMAFDSSDSEARWQDARKGVAGHDTLLARTQAWLTWMGHGFSRHFINLPNIAKFADVREQLRKVEAAPQASRERIVRYLRRLTEGMTSADLDLFTRKVVLDDLSWEVEQEHDLAFGMTPEDVSREKAKIDAIIERRPDLAAAVRQRKRISRMIADQLVEAGVLHAEQIKNPAYYRHQVLDYARAIVSEAKGRSTYEPRIGGVKRRLRTPHWARRMGSTLDINANLLEAEFDWLYKALVDIRTAETITWIKESEHNVRNEVIRAARESNARLVRRAIDAEGDGGPLHDQWSRFRQRIAIGFSKIATEIEEGRLQPPPEFEHTVEQMLEQAEIRRAERADEVPLEEQTRVGEGVDDLFPFLAWVIDNGKPGAAGAQMVFKAINARKLWVKNLLGRQYADTMNVDSLVGRFAPEGYVAWQPDEGKLLFTAKTIPEHVVDRMLDKLSAEPVGPISAEEMRAAFETVRSILAVGGNKHELVIPEELASTLNSIRDEHAEGLFEALVEGPQRWWKRWVLINPRRVLKYNINNLSGDLDAVIAGSPKGLRELPRAIKELWAVMHKGETPSERYREAVERGVFDSGLSIQEIPDINYLSEFEDLIVKSSPLKRPDRFALSGLMKVWRALQRYTQFRENWLRYAAYLDYVQRLEAGESMKSIGYGAAVPEMVDAVTDPKDRAALLARELVGDYGNVSHFGQGIRRKTIPFWSWQEINAKRYWRLSSNAFSGGIGKGFATAGGLGAMMGARTTAYLALRMIAMYAVIQLWNNLGPYSDDEDELPEDERVRLHLNLGRDDEGNILSLRFQGALSDALAWIGFADVVQAAAEVEKGRASFGEVLKAFIKAPVNKIVQGITPVIKVPFEFATGRALFPDVMRPMPIRDDWRNLARTFSLEHEYDLVFDKPTRGYGRSLEETAIYKRDAGEIAYQRARELAFDWLRREKGTEGSSSYRTPRSEALYEWRLAKRYGDDEAADRARERLRELGVDRDDLAASIKRAHPIGAIAIKDRAKFKGTLTPRELDVLGRGIDWYRETFAPSP